MSPREILEKWMTALRSGDIDGVVGMYADHSILLPTFSPHRLAGELELRKYFEQLFARDDLHVALHEESLRILPMGGTAYTVVGVYSFTFAVDDTELTFPSRFTFVFDTALDAPIVHHHSSQVPRTLS